MPPVETDADLESFFDEEEFATVVVTPKGDFVAIFDEAFQMAFANPGLEGAMPALTVSSKSVSRLELRAGDPVVITIEGVEKAFRVQRAEPDGTGVSMLVLKK